ncbi:AI-2E family transporter [Youngiibacter multivorans]|uniref:AI-2E family transporter n=1 Tax=Youngiibacter multivorans TaxID=937251 RepID=UPI001AE1A740|nr:AI-2E family transporter [Youngiibacter multivorans]
MTNGAVKDHIKRYDQIVIYFVCYTLTFIIFTTTLRYTIPFVLAFIFASVLSKLIRRLSSKFGIDQKYIRLPIIALFFGIIGTLLTMLVISIANQAVIFGVSVVNYFTENGESIMFWFNERYHWLISQIENLDPRLIESGNQMLNSALMSIRDISLSLGTAIGKFSMVSITGIPSLLLVIIFTVVCTFLFTRLMVKEPHFLLKYMPIEKEHEGRFIGIFNEGKDMVIKYALSYLLVIFITGMISSVGYMILGIPYALLLGLVTAFLDLLPILGVSAAYIPLGIYFFAHGNIVVPFGLVILWVIVAVGRNIWEPRIVASTLDMSPIITIMAIFIGLKLNGVPGMFYLMFMAVGFKVMQKVKVIDTFAGNAENQGGIQ